MPYKCARDFKTNLSIGRKAFISAFLSILLLGPLGSDAFAISSQEELQQILNQIPSEWWNGGWDDLVELESFIQAHPEHPDMCATAQFYIGAYYNGVKEYEKSVRAHQTLLTKYPMSKECGKSLWEIGYIQQHRLKNLAEAIRVYQQIINNYGESEEAPKAMLALGIVYHKVRQSDAAIRTYQDLLRKYPDADEAPRSLLKVGIIYGEMKKKDQELQSYNQILQTYGHTKYAPEAKLLIGECYMRSDDHEKAIATFQEMKTDYPTADKIPQALIYIGACNRELKRWNEEIAAYREVLTKYGSTEYAPRANFELGECYQFAKKYTTAIEVLRELVWKYPKSEEAPRALIKIGIINRKMKKFNDELSMYQKVIEHFGNTKYAPDAQLKVGEVYDRAKEYAKATGAYRDLVDNFPHADEAPRALMKLARIFVRMREPDSVVQTYREVSDSYPASEYAWQAKLEIGHHHINMGDMEGARKYFDEVLRGYLYAGRPRIEAFMALGDIAGGMGDHEESLRQYKEAALVSYFQIGLVRELIGKISDEMMRVDGNSERSNRFLMYQLYGPNGADGYVGTTDDLVDPLNENQTESVRLREAREKELGEKQNMEVEVYLLRLLGKLAEADVIEGRLLTTHEGKVEEPSTLKSERVAALRTIMFALKKVADPTESKEIYRTSLRAKRKRWEELEKQAERLALQYANDPQEVYIRDVEVEARYQIGMLDESLGEYGKAIEQYGMIAADGPTERWRLFGRFVMAHAYINEHEDEKGLKIFQDVIVENKAKASWLAGAHYGLACHHKNRGELEEAKRYLREIIEKYPQTAWSETAKETLAELR